MISLKFDYKPGYLIEYDGGASFCKNEDELRSFANNFFKDQFRSEDGGFFLKYLNRLEVVSSLEEHGCEVSPANTKDWNDYTKKEYSPYEL